MAAIADCTDYQSEVLQVTGTAWLGYKVIQSPGAEAAFKECGATISERFNRYCAMHLNHQTDSVAYCEAISRQPHF